MERIITFLFSYIEFESNSQLPKIISLSAECCVISKDTQKMKAFII